MSKKKFIAILVIIVIVSFGIGFLIAKNSGGENTDDTTTTATEGASQTVEDSVSVITDESTEEATEETTEESTTEAPKESKSISTDLFSVVTPMTWDGEYSYSIRGYNDNGAYGLRFTHKDSADSGNGGLVFVIEVHPTDEAYPEMMENSPVPYEYMGVIDVPGDTKYDVIITYPSDVQYSDETEDGYTQLKDSVDEVIESLEVVDNAEFIKN